MSRKFHLTLEVEMPDDATVSDARLWLASVLDTAFTQKNPVPCPEHGLARGWTPRVPVPPSEHGYKPRIVHEACCEVAQPAPRKTP